MSELIRPTTRQLLRLNAGHLTPAGRKHPLGQALLEYAEFADRIADFRAGDGPIIAGGASFSDYLEAKALEHITGKASYTEPTFWLALCTVVPEDSKTGSTITEASYTGYKRLKVEGSKWTVSGTSPTAIKNNVKLEFAACTEGSSTVIGWAGCDAETVGDMLVWGTATSTVISVTQTPAQVAAENLVISLD